MSVERMQVAVYGAAGRMGRSVINVIMKDPGIDLVAAVDRTGCPALGQDAAVLAGGSKAIGVNIADDLDRALEGAEVVIDFSLPQAVRPLMTACAKRAVPCVVGTTGLHSDAAAAVDELAATTPVVVAPNFSVGVNVLWYLAEQAVTLLGQDFDVEIVEMHHRNKVDAPSGTAVCLLQAAAGARGVDPKKASIHGRSGQVGARTREEIGVFAMRGGDVVGEHTMVLAGPGERVELGHRAHSREIFARGAVRAAHWVKGQKPGRYDMADVLGLPR